MPHDREHRVMESGLTSSSFLAGLVTSLVLAVTRRSEEAIPHLLSGFSLVDIEPFSFSTLANCSRT